MRAWTRQNATMAGCLVLLAMFGRGQDKPEAKGPTRHIQQERLWANLQKLSEFGKNPEGGVSRVGFTEADLAGRTYVMGLMREAGLTEVADG